MPKFTAFVALHDAEGNLVEFSPGSVAPSWVKDRVGDHVLDKPFGRKPARNTPPANGKGDPEKDSSEEQDPVSEVPEKVDPESEETSEGSKEEGEELSFTGDE